jgi:hypothetical protein
MSKDKLKFSHRIVKLPLQGIKGKVMSGTDELVFHTTVGGADYPANRNLYEILNLPSGKLVCRAMTEKNARIIIENLHTMNFNWSEVWLEGSKESQRLRDEIELLKNQKIVY